MITKKPTLASGTGHSIVVERCQVCDACALKSVLFVGYLPPVNDMVPIGTPPCEQPAYPAELLLCEQCHLFQLGLIVDPQVLFPPSYPYTSGTTRILRENFAELYREIQTFYPLKEGDFVVDIGSNDGTLLGNFKSHKCLGIEPTDAGKLAMERGIQTETRFFTSTVAQNVAKRHGKAKVITAANCFAHIENVHEIVGGVLDLLREDGVFITESHYLLSLLDDIQYDTIYHEHLRYYSATSLSHLFRMHGLEIIHAKKIPTHGGSIRVYAAKLGTYPVRDTVTSLLDSENKQITPEKLKAFRSRVVESKLGLHALLLDIKRQKARVYGIGAPSRASTLIHYVGLDDGILNCVLEIQGSYKIGKYIPGTRIAVMEESRLFTDPPEYALLLSWHIADELIPKLREKGFRGKFIVPLPTPEIR